MRIGMAAPPEERCEFATDVSADYFEPDKESLLRTTETGQWRCPHHKFAPTDGPDDGYDFCPFHLGHEPNHGAAVLADTAELCVWLITGSTEQVLGLGPLPSDLRNYAERENDSARFETGERTQFIGAVFEEFRLDYRTIDAVSNAPVDLREATVNEVASFQSASFEQPLLLSGAVFNCSTTFVDTTFAERTEFQQTQFTEDTDFHHATFGAWAGFSSATIAGEANFRGVDFDHGIFGMNMVFHGAADFMAATFAAVANFTGSAFRRGAVFSSTRFFGNATFRDVSFSGPVELSDNFVDDTDVDERWQRVAVDGRRVQDAAVVFRNLTCEGKLNLVDASIDGDVYIASSTMAGAVVATDISVKNGPIELNFTGSEVISGRVATGSEPIKYDFSEGTLGELEIGDSNVDSVQFSKTTFDGFDFGKHLDLFVSMEWQLHSEQASPSECENTYLRAKNGAKQVGESRAVSEFYLLELRHRRAGYLKLIRDTFPGVQALKASTKLLGNLTLAVTCGYGERPLRPVVASVSVVGVFAILYATIGISLPYEGATKYLTFSFESFVALLIGQPETTSSITSLLVALEGFLGAFMIALFVFSFTRSVSR
jgi:hypothetical protein